MTEINAAKMMIENVEKYVDYRKDNDFTIKENALFWAEILNAWSNHRQADSINSIDIAAQRIEERMTEIEGQLGRIANVLESVKGKAYVEEGYVDCLFVSPPRV